MFDWNGFKAKKLRDGIENAEVTLVYDLVSDEETTSLQRYFDVDLTKEYSGVCCTHSSNSSNRSSRVVPRWLRSHYATIYYPLPPRTAGDGVCRRSQFLPCLAGNTALATDDELQEKIYSYIRTSHGGWVPEHSEVIQEVSKRIAKLLQIPPQYCEVS